MTSDQAGPPQAALEGEPGVLGYSVAQPTALQAGWRRYPTLRAAAGLAGWARRSFFSMGFVRSAGAWTLVSALALGVTALIIDFIMLAQAEKPPSTALVVSVSAASLGILLAFIVGPALAIIAVCVNHLAQTRSVVRWLWWVPIVLCGWVVATRMLDLFPELPLIHYGSQIAAALVLTAVALLGRSRLRPVRLLALLIGTIALVLDAHGDRNAYRDLRDFAGVVGCFALMVAPAPFRHRMLAVRARVLFVSLVTLALSASVFVSAVGWLSPGWRTSAIQYGHYAPRFAFLFRSVIDLDADGFSPVAWGGDCDDFDATRNPLARETRVGHDNNCNHIVLSARPTDRDRGLERPVGDPDLEAGTIDRVILVTIDCMRYEAMRRDVMPNTVAFAARGVVMSRLYSGGSRTHLSLPLIQRGSDDASPVARRLLAAKVTSTAILGYIDVAMRGIVEGFKVISSATNKVPWMPAMSVLGPTDPSEGRFDARVITDRAIADLHRATGPHYLWLHYFDAHVPYALTKRKKIGDEDDPYEDYLTELRFIDSQLARLYDELYRAGWMGRTVVILTADHGEGFGDHGVRYHGVSAYEAQIHVPGMIVAPGLLPGTYDGLVSHRDIPATVLGAFGGVARDPTIELFGRSWLRLREAPTARLHRFVVSRTSRASSVHGFVTPMASIVDGRFKLIKTFEDGLRELYDIFGDPDELTNLEPEDRVHLRTLETELETYRDIDAYP